MSAAHTQKSSGPRQKRWSLLMFADACCFQSFVCTNREKDREIKRKRRKMEIETEGNKESKKDRKEERDKRDK